MIKLFASDDIRRYTFTMDHHVVVVTYDEYALHIDVRLVFNSLVDLLPESDAHCMMGPTTLESFALFLRLRDMIGRIGRPSVQRIMERSVLA